MESGQYAFGQYAFGQYAFGQYAYGCILASLSSFARDDLRASDILAA